MPNERLALLMDAAECERLGMKVIEPELAQVVQAAAAIRTAEKINVSNPLHVSKKIVARFSRVVTDLEGERESQKRRDLGGEAS